MFTLDRNQLLAIARYPETIGSMIFHLALPGGSGWGVDSIDFEPQNGWTKTDPSPRAQARYGDLPLQSYVDPTGTITLTAAQGEYIHYMAEGDGWVVECDDCNSGWQEEGFFANRSPHTW